MMTIAITLAARRFGSSTRFFFVLTIIYSALIGAVYGADVSVVEGKMTSGVYGNKCLVAHVALTGDITDGDADKLADVIATIGKIAQAQKSSCYINDGSADRLIYVQLESNGGAYMEGWKIAKLLSDYHTLAATYVGKGSYCYSACAIAFLGGSVPGAEGATLSRRIIHPTATLGFHAPFPVLEEHAYDAETVREFFLTAFTVASSFMKEAKALGISYEVAQLLLQPTPSSFYEINTSGRSILTNISVSSAPFNFSVYASDVKTDQITPKTLVNLCLNNQTLRNSGDSGPSTEFLASRIESKAQLFTEVKSKTGYFGPDKTIANVLVVPVADAGEGDVQSCVTEVVPTNKPDHTLKFACLGFAYGEQELATKITKIGIDQINFGAHDLCLTSSKLALLPFDTKLSDIPEEYLGN